MSGEKPREIALQILLERKSGRFVEDLLDAALSGSGMLASDRALCQELVYGVLRWQATLDWLIDQKTANRPQKPVLRELLRLGLYQIFWLDRIPNHAAVNETVESAKRHRLTAQAGFVNALLRGYLRNFEPTKKALAGLKSSSPALGFSHPEWLVKRWEKRWGRDQTISLLEWNNTPAKTFARVNSLKADPGKLLTQWRDEGVEYDFVRRDWLPENLVFELKSHPPLARLPSFKQGLFYIQDPSTLFAVHALDPKPGESILDLCAAPGGKLTYMVQLVHNEARIIAHDANAERLKLIEENCARLGVTCVRILGLERGVHAASSLEHLKGLETAEGLRVGATGSGVNAALQCSDTAQDHSTSSSSLASLTSHFDKILVDAPCSNTGVLRRRVDLRWRIQPDEIIRLRQLQLQLLTQAAALVKSGGSLIYSTCSLEPEENSGVIDEFVAAQSSFQLASTRELLPFKDDMDGAFVAIFQRY